MECLMCKHLKESKLVVLKTKYTTVVVNPNQFYKGRCVAIFNKHVVSEKDMSDEELTRFFADALKAGLAVDKLKEVVRVNYAWLNNRDYHVHWHIIPRRKTDPRPDYSPWWTKKKRLADEKELNKTYRVILEKLGGN